MNSFGRAVAPNRTRNVLIEVIRSDLSLSKQMAETNSMRTGTFKHDGRTGAQRESVSFAVKVLC